MSTEHTKRRKAVLAEVASRKLDCLLVTHPAIWYYLTGFTGESGALVVSDDGATLLTDGRFTVQAKEETRGVRIELQQGGLFAAAGAFLRKKGWGRIGYDANQLTVTQWNTLRKASGSKARGVEATGIVERLRMRKDAQELAMMRKAAILAGEVLEGVLKMVKPGVRENELGAEIEYQMKKRGASGASFETIVASGPRGALPHARPTGKKLRKNELVVLDLGAILAHYCSDMTRTVFLGRASRKVRGWYGAVLEAQQAAIAKVQDGVTCGEVDAVAREVLKKHHLEAFFVHSTGHGL